MIIHPPFTMGVSSLLSGCVDVILEFRPKDNIFAGITQETRN